MIFTRLIRASIGALRAERRYHARLKELYRLSERERSHRPVSIRHSPGSMGKRAGLNLPRALKFP